MKCPKCGKTVLRATAESIKLDEHGGTELKGAAFCCPHCETILGVGIDQLALCDDIARTVLERMKGKG